MPPICGFFADALQSCLGFDCHRRLLSRFETERLLEKNSMTPIKLLLAPIRRIVSFPLFQLAVTVAVILWLQGASDSTALGQIYNALDRLVDFSV
jgi:hypothetical protein